MHKDDVSIATITWARDETEEAVLRDSLQRLAALHLPVYITDAGSGPAFLYFLRSFSHFTLLPAGPKGAWPQAKNSISAAGRSGSPFIFYTEPDKGDFFSRFLPRMVAEVPADEQSGVALASRSAAGFATFPSFQQMTETTINRCCAEVIGKEVDYTYGPFLLNRELVPRLERLEVDTGWGWRPYAFGMAHRLGYRVDAFVDDFSCPVNQQKDNPAERLYRMRQLSQNIQGLVLAAAAVLAG